MLYILKTKKKKLFYKNTIISYIFKIYLHKYGFQKKQIFTKKIGLIKSSFFMKKIIIDKFLIYK